MRYLSGVHADFLTVHDTPTDIGHLTSVGTNNVHMQNATETIESMENILHTNQAPCPNTPITVTIGVRRVPLQGGAKVQRSTPPPNYVNVWR